MILCAAAYAARVREALAAAGLTAREAAARLGLDERRVGEALDAGRAEILDKVADYAGAAVRAEERDQLPRLRDAARALGLTDREALDAALARAVAAGEPADALMARLARLIGRDGAAVSRALAGASLDRDARDRLLLHLAGELALPPRAARGRPSTRRR